MSLHRDDCNTCSRRGFLKSSAAALGAGVALYIWIVMRPTDLVIGGWVATVVAAVWIGKKIAREIVYGAMRSRNVPATEAIPPTTAGDQGST